MSRWIDADKCITAQFYDDEHEEWSEKSMTIAEFLDIGTEEGCPSAEPRPVCEDAISREWTLKELNAESEKDYPSFRRVMEKIEDAPPVEPKRPKGEWKYGNGNGECPFCGRERQHGWNNFCGFCGADMRGDTE